MKSTPEWPHVPKWRCRACGTTFGLVNEDWPKLSQRAIKLLAAAIVDSMTVETKTTKRGGLVLEMKLPKPRKRAKRKVKKNA